MITFIILISLISLLTLYLIVSKIDKTYFNFLTPSFIIFIPSNYIFELLYLYYYPAEYKTISYFFTYLTYVLYFSSIVFGYIIFNFPQTPTPQTQKKITTLLPYIILSISIVVYLPIIINFKDIILSPREIYRETRSGYGLFYFISTTLTYLAFIIFLSIKKLVPLIACFILMIFHGSKGHILSLFTLYFLFQAYVLKVKYSLSKVLLICLAVSSIILGSFQFFAKNIDTKDILLVVSEYSDYTRNSLLIIESDIDKQFGKLTIEGNIITRIPRTFYPDKPKNFGTFFLSEYFFPQRFILEAGDPDFGLIGLAFADFGYFSIFYLIFWGIITGACIKTLSQRLKSNPSVGSFILFAFFSGITLIPTGSGYLIFEHLLLAILANKLIDYFSYSQHLSNSYATNN